MRFSHFLILRALTAISNSSPIARRQGSSSLPSAKALYFADNDPEGNHIYALTVNSNGSLSDGGVYLTGGLGGALIQPGTNMPDIEDALSSAGSVVSANEQLFVVNAGSHTLSMFNIDPNSPTNLTLVGEPVDTLGDYPVSVAASAKLGQVCVANTGSYSGIACMPFSSEGIWQPQHLLAFQLNQTTPPTDSVGMTNLSDGRPHYAHIEFNQDSSALLATILPGPMPANSPPYAVSYPVVDGAVSASYNIQSYSLIDQLFQVVNIPNNDTVFVIGGANTYLFLDQNADTGVSQPTSRYNITGGRASCWAVYSTTYDTIYIDDANNNRFQEIDPISGQIIGTYNVTQNTKLGMLDMATFGNSVYGLSPAFKNASASVMTLDISQGKGQARVVQDFYPTGLGMSKTVQGMAIYG
ncbi:hypothetical protein MMC25_006012 [Agyrium rufum]|nr:hypothetical protein [Agyrium rufum]